jgi:hypothetical protein
MLNHLALKVKMISLSVLAVITVGMVISYLTVKQVMLAINQNRLCKV